MSHSLYFCYLEVNVDFFMFVVRYLSQRIVEDLLMTDSPGGIVFLCVHVCACF